MPHLCPRILNLVEPDCLLQYVDNIALHNISSSQHFITTVIDGAAFCILSLEIYSVSADTMFLLLSRLVHILYDHYATINTDSKRRALNVAVALENVCCFKFLQRIRRSGAVLCFAFSSGHCQKETRWTLYY